MAEYGMGLDLGSGSVGWATVDLDSSGKPIAVGQMGIRRFDAGVSGDISSGRDESNAAERRSKRGPRKQHWRRAFRIRQIFRLLVEWELLPPVGSDSPEARHQCILDLDEQLRTQFPANDHSQEHLLPYRLRAAALDGPLPPLALGRALYSLAQRRGYQTNRKAASDDDKDEGVVKRGIADLDSAMSEAGVRTIGEYFATIDPESTHLRRRWTARRIFKREFDEIWKTQSPHHPQLTDKAYKRLEKAIFFQRPLKSQRHLVGRCELERHPVPHRIRPGRQSPSGTEQTRYVGRQCAFIGCLPYQEFRLLQKVNDLRFTEPDGTPQRLNDPANEHLRQMLLEKLFRQGEITFGAIRKLFGMKKSKEYDRNVVFNFESDGDSKLIGNRTAAKLARVLGPKWYAMSHQRQGQLVDEMLQFESADRLATRLHEGLALDGDDASKLSKIVLEQGFGKLSRRAINKLLPLMREGKNFHDAKIAAGYVTGNVGRVYPLLPPLDEVMPEVRNPAAIRVLTEMRKVVNEIVRQHDGRKPKWIRVELARDLKNSRKKRQDILKQNRKNERERTAAAKKILGAMSNDERYVTRENILKVRLAEECGFQCPYSGDSIGMRDLVGDEPKFEVEHIIPFSKCLDNSFLNKTLCHIKWNRDKGQKTPWKAFGDTEQYEEMLQRVRMFRGDAREAKLKKFQMQSLDDQSGFVNRQLNDTRYAARAAAEYLGVLYGGGHVTGTDQRVFPTSGRITAYLRQRWDLNQIIGHPDQKNRADHRHHAIDALVTALSDPPAVKMLSDAARRAQETGQKLFAEVEPAFPDLIDQATEAVEAIAVSSRADRKINGPMHKETILSPPVIIGYQSDGQPIVEHHVRKSLNSLSPGEVLDIVDPSVRRNVQIALEMIGKPPTEAFKEETNLPSLHGKNGHTTPIRSARIVKKASPMQIGDGPSERFVNPGANHHMAIIAQLDSNGQELQWTAELVTRFEAMTRARHHQPVVHRINEDRRRFKFHLCGGDHVLLNRTGRDELCRVTVLSGTNIEFVLHTNANPDTVRKKNKGERIRCAVSKLKDFNTRKVDVLPTGRVIVIDEEAK